ncbi:MAG: VWA domain-containing protein [Myxococcota bacterium]
MSFLPSPFSVRCGGLVGFAMLAATACSFEGLSSDDAQPGGYGAGDAVGVGATTVGPGSTGSGTGSGGNTFAPPQDEDPPAACEALDPNQPTVLYLSADDSNSMASPAMARGALEIGAPVRPATIRTYEFLNYYRIDYEPPAEGDLNVVPQLALGTEPGTYDLQIGVRSHDALTRRPMTITLVLDTSGSMQGLPIARERAVVRAIAMNLSAGDIVNAVTWSDSQATLLDGHVVSGPNDPAVIAVADGLVANGGTDLDAGLRRGYEMAEAYYGASRLNRVVLISDGGANTGVVAPELIGGPADDADAEGIYLVGVGTSPPQTYADDLMDEVTDLGRGAHVFVSSDEEAIGMFGDRFDEVFEVAARGVRVELTLPWYFQMYRFYGEEYSTVAEEIEPQHLAPNDAMVFNQVLRACDPEVVNLTDTITVRTTWTEPLTYQPRETSVTLTVDTMLASASPQLEKGKAIVAFAEALKAGTTEAMSAAREAVEAANLDGLDPELSDIAQQIERHPATPFSP